MRAMVLDRPGQPLREADLPDPSPGPGQVLIRVGVCGVCRTDLHVVDGDLTEPRLPVVPGHQIVGTVTALAEAAAGVDTAPRAARTSAGRPAPPATRSTAASPRGASPTSGSAFRFPTGTRTSRRRRSCVRGLSATGRTG